MFNLFKVQEEYNYIYINILGIKLYFNKQEYVIPYIETHVVDHCNLNCKGCSHYCPITEKHFVSYEKFEKNIKQISKKFKVEKFFLMGGEPLLHPDINKFIEISRKYLKETEICLLTNATLLGKKDETFWNVLKTNNVEIGITKYPVNIENFDNLIHKAQNYGVKIGAIHNGNKFAFRLSTKANIEDFHYCPTKNCINLRDDKLYICPIGCYMDNYNRYFKTNYPVEKGINIYKNPPEKILKYLQGPSPTCNICLAKEEDWEWQEWSVSNKKAEDWFVAKDKEKANVIY